MKKLLLILAVMCCCVAFSGCTVFETDTEALMQPPVFTEEQEKLNFALTEVIGEDYTLKYPKNGKINSAFIFRDLDGDGTEEAMAFYSVLDESTRINILKNTGNGWLSVYEAAGFFGDIESIDFAKIDEGNEVLVVKWEQEVRIYRFENERLETVHTSSCDGVEITDIDGDKFDEVAIFFGNASGRTVLNILYSSGEEILVTENVSINAQYQNIYSTKAGKLTEEINAYFIDSKIYEGVYLTEIITFDNGKAKRCFVADFMEDEDEEKDGEEKENSGMVVIVGNSYGKRGIFLRNTKTSCMDINGDGIIEFPVEVREDYAQEASEKTFFVQYVQYTGVGIYTAWHGIVNAEGGYLLSLPKPWNTETLFSIGPSGTELVVTENENNTKILEVFAVPKSDYQDKYEDCILAAEDETTNYYVKQSVGSEDRFYIDPESYKDLFIFI